MKSLISIIVPCCNQAQYLSEALQSVLNQTYQNWECIIVNDGSPDNTEEVANDWLQRDNRFSYVFQNNKGLAAARNLGVQHAQGEWILPLDSDDYISNDYLYLAYQQFQNQYSLIYCNAKTFGIKNEFLKLGDFNLKNLAINNVIFATAFFKKTDWLTIGGYDEELLKGLEDWEFWIQLLKKGGRVYKLSEICFYYRIKEVSMLTEFIKDDAATLRYIEKKHYEFFAEQLGSISKLYGKVQKYEGILNGKSFGIVYRCIAAVHSLFNKQR